MDFLKLLITLFALTILSNANAALIDNGDYTTDSDTGLDWLDLSMTDGYVYNDVLSSFSGWRYASNDEVVGLFNTAFSGYYDTSAIGYSSSGNFGSHTYTGYTEQYSDAIAFTSLFGYTESYSFSTYATNLSYGFFENELGILAFAGVYEVTGDIGGIYSEYTDVYSPDNVLDYSQFFTEGHPQAGIFLVRDTATVPEPSSLLLLSLGLFGVIGFAVRKI